MNQNHKTLALSIICDNDNGKIFEKTKSTEIFNIFGVIDNMNQKKAHRK